MVWIVATTNRKAKTERSCEKTARVIFREIKREDTRIIHSLEGGMWRVQIHVCYAYIDMNYSYPFGKVYNYNISQQYLVLSELD